MTAGSRGYYAFILIIAAILFAAGGCYRGEPSKKPPIHPIPDMDSQPKYKPQGQSKFFADSSDMRMPVEGTVALGYLREKTEYYQGKDSGGQFIEKAPVEINMQTMKRGEERYNIYCSPCHSRIGDGQGIIIDKGFPPPPSFHIDRIRKLPDGQIFDVITNGLRNMPSYGHQVMPADRWAIVIYLRALQRSQDASLSDIPEDMQDKLK
jgi:mono/diheme cytochrome c family protein